MPELPLGFADEDQRREGALVEHFFRHEAGRLHGSLLRRFGMQHFGLVEDVVQEAMLRALRTWAMGGVPANPSAWISRVAINLALDALRHRGMAADKEADIKHHTEIATDSVDAGAIAPADEEIRDDTLRLLLVCCHPSIAPDAQVILALKMICGFGLPEIARAFLSSEAAIEKQLTRTKLKLRDSGVSSELPEDAAELATRLHGALGTLYLLFNEGYKASQGEQLLREDLCAEAIRLTSLLVEHPMGDTPATHALLALMLLHSARFSARTNAQGALLRLAEQDRTKWDQTKIDQGLRHLGAAAGGTAITEYHIQAGIAACHCLATESNATDWGHILAHYDALYQLKPSPIVALNRAVALANLDGPQAGLDAIAEIGDLEKLESSHFVHAVRGDLYWRLNRPTAAAASFRRALSLARVGPEQNHLTRLLEQVSPAG